MELRQLLRNGDKIMVEFCLGFFVCLGLVLLLSVLVTVFLFMKTTKQDTPSERFYYDTGGVKCNLNEMLRREPEWVVSRFHEMENSVKRLKDSLNMIALQTNDEATRAWVKKILKKEEKTFDNTA